MNKEHIVWINARFLGRPITGVERVARELLAGQLDERGLRGAADGTLLKFQLVGPPGGPADSPWPNLPLTRLGRGGGHLWEQTSLPVATRDGWLDTGIIERRDPARPDSLADAIRRLLREPGLRDDLVARGRARAARHSWARSAETLLATLTRAMGVNPVKVAVVHDWLVIYGGAERVLEHILDCYPQADVFSLIDDVPESQRHFLRGKTPKTSFMQRLPFAKKHYRKMLPLMPYAIEQLDVSAYDLILSSSYAVAKGVLTGPNQLHVCYCHSPMRYAWDHYHFYLEATGLNKGIESILARWQLHKVRNWDARNSLSVDRFLANSRFVRERIWKCYRREAELLYPPIDTGLFKLYEPKEDFYVAAGRFVPYKRIDLAAEAFASMPDKKLILLGDGPEMENIRKKCRPNVQCIGFQPPEILRDYLSRAKAFIVPGEEDFGIVPVEAQACGTPVIAFERGGVLETVISPESAAARGVAPTGLFFNEQSAASIADAVRRFDAMPGTFNAPAIAKHASTFAPENFKRDLMAHVEAGWAEKRARMAR